MSGRVPITVIVVDIAVSTQEPVKREEPGSEGQVSQLLDLSLIQVSQLLELFKESAVLIRVVSQSQCKLNCLRCGSEGYSKPEIFDFESSLRPIYIKSYILPSGVQQSAVTVQTWELEDHDFNNYPCH